MSQKAYFLVPSIDYAPDKLIKIGQIISSLKTPHLAIGKPLDTAEIHSSYQQNWEDERRQSISGSVGIWTKFLATILGLGADIGGNLVRDDSTVWKFERLDTFFIVPDQEYIEASMAVPAVKKFYEENPRKPAYMITGVKIARGAALVLTKGRSLGADGNVGIDATAGGIPISFGPKASVKKERTKIESFTGSSDFVFAYRLIKIYKHEKTGVATSKEEVKGALYELDSSTATGHGFPRRDNSKANSPDMEILELEIEGFDKEDLGLKSAPTAFEKGSFREGGKDGEMCEVIWLKEDIE